MEGLKVWKWEKGICVTGREHVRGRVTGCVAECLCRSHSLGGSWPNVELNFLQTLSCQVMFPSHSALHHHKHSAQKQSRAGQNPPLKAQPVKWLHSWHTHQMGKQSHWLSSQVVSERPGGLTHIHAETALPRYKETRGVNRPMFSYCPSNSSEQTVSLHKGSNRKMQKNVTIRPSEFAASCCKECSPFPTLAQPCLKNGAITHEPWTNEKPAILQRLTLQKGLHEASKQTLSYKNTSITLTSQK